MNKHTKALTDMDACEEAVKWAATQPSLKQAWRVCYRGDWMLWYAGRVGADRKTLVLAACDCAELAIKYWSEGDDRPSEALRVARAWANDEDGVTLRDVRSAAKSAESAAFTAESMFDAYAAAWSATYAAESASADDAASYAAWSATYAAESASADDAASYAASAAAEAAVDGSKRQKTLRQTATIVRRYWPTLPTTEPNHEPKTNI